MTFPEFELLVHPGVRAHAPFPGLDLHAVTGADGRGQGLRFSSTCLGVAMNCWS